MAFLDDMLTLAQNKGLGTPGTDLFQSLLPDSPDTLVAFFEYQGRRPLFAMQPSRANTIERPTLHAAVRGATYETAVLLADSVFQAFNGYSGIVGSVNYLFICAIVSPVDVGRDELGRSRLVINFEVSRINP